jgi:large-conductance mechanosensitive channel
MDIFSDRQSNLIAPKIQKSIDKIIENKPEAVTVSDKVSQAIKSFYNNYISPYKVTFFILSVIIIFLLYRWYTRKPKKTAKEKFTSEEYKILKNILTTQSAELRYDDQPHFNPLYSVADQEQKQKVYYPPDPLPVNIPNQGFVYTRDLYNEPDQTLLLNSPKDYDYNTANRSRLYYNGTYNTYENAQDTNIINPLGFSNQFNTTTGNFVGGMTERNTDVLRQYQNIVNNKTEDDCTVLPPYATELP